MNKTAFFIIFLTFHVGCTFGQVETKYIQDNTALSNIKFLKGINLKQILIDLPSLDNEKLSKENEVIKGLKMPYRFGKGHDVTYKIEEGDWVDCDNGRVWSKTFRSKGALSLNFVFEDFYLPEESCLYIINQDSSLLYGPVKSEAIPSNGFFLTDIIPGQSATILLYEPNEQRGKCSLSIKKVVHGFRGFFPQMQNRQIGSSESCNNDIICFPEYEKESNAAALVLLENGTECCSGSMLMTTDLSFKPFFLTAFHCIDSNHNGLLSTSEIESAQKWLFKFQYKKTTCNGNSYSNGISYNAYCFSKWVNKIRG